MKKYAPNRVLIQGASSDMTQSNAMSDWVTTKLKRYRVQYTLADRAPRRSAPLHRWAATAVSRSSATLRITKKFGSSQRVGCPSHG